MNAYVVQIPETRAESYIGADGPPEPWTPTGIFVAATPAQAKRDALYVWTNQSTSGVYDDDWTSLRVRLLERDVDLFVRLPRGELAETAPGKAHDRLWWRVHEVLDHDGRPCDCPAGEAA